MDMRASGVVAVVLLACTGPKGDPGQEGPVGPSGLQGVTGPTGPAGTFAGAFVGDAGISGNVTISGDLTAGGHVLTYPRQPLLLAGMSPQGCSNAASAAFPNGTVIFPTSFPGNPVLVGTVDESNDDNGATWLRILQNAPNRVAIRCGDAPSPADAIHWLAIEPGVHQISGKRVMAGSATGAVSGGSVSFPMPFSAPPVVFLTIDESVDNGGGTVSRVIGNVTATGFQYWLDGSSDALNWVAMDPGDYQHGRYSWTAGVISTANSCSAGCTYTLPNALATAPVALLTINDTDNSGAIYARLLRVTRTQIRFRMNSTTENVFYLLLQEAP